MIFSGGEKCLLQAKNDPQVPESIQSLMSQRDVHLNFTKSYGRVAYLEFDLAHPHDAPALLDAYVHFFYNHRSAAALGYKSPVQFKTERGF